MNSIKESKADRKLCPLILNGILSAKVHNGLLSKDDTDRVIRDQILMDAWCWGKDCMMWKWSDIKRGSGYCGLGGKHDTD